MTQREGNERIDQIRSIFKNNFGCEPSLIVRAPGRVNLIGEHTDYNGGFVLPSAIDREMMIAASPRADKTVRTYSDDYKQSDEFSIDSIIKSDKHPWTDYLRGTISILIQAGYRVSGFDAVLSGNVPQGAGLSSSAAYEVAVVILAREMFGLKIASKDAALLAQRAENEFIGVQCGIMDQFISALGQRDSALLIDCRSLEFKPVALNLAKHGLSIVITNSGVRRGLVDSEYNARRAECARGTEELSNLLGRKLHQLRDVTTAEFAQFESRLPDLVASRCRHVVRENERVHKAVGALQSGNMAVFGELMNESHRSLRDDFQVSCREVDVLVEMTQKHQGVIGARMTGAGFGGCTVAIMAASAVGEFERKVLPAYEKTTGRKSQLWICSAVSGAGSVIAAQPA